MKCPYCGVDNDKVVDSRPIDENTAIKRRRICLNCGKRFVTYERYEKANIMVVKRDGKKQSYDRDKIMRGLLKACEKRPVQVSTLNEITENIENALRGRREVSSKEIGEMVMNSLRELDQVAYVRFASVYRRFEDIDSFSKELETLKDGKKR